eukprot:UN30433
MKALSRCRKVDHCKQIYKEMIDNDIKPNELTYTVYISALTKSGDVNDCNIALELFNKDILGAIKIDLPLLNAVLGIFEKLGDLSTSLKLFQQYKSILQPNVITFTNLITTARKMNKWEICLRLYNEMKSLKIHPNVVVCSAMLSALTKSGDVSYIRGIWSDVEKYKIKKDAILYGSYIHSLCSVGHWKAATDTFVKLTSNFNSPPSPVAVN